MVRIQEENAHYNLQLQEKYMRYSGANMFFTENEQKWLSAHGAIRVGYLDDYLAFCARDRGSGALTGALQAFLTMAAQGMQNATVAFEAVPYATTTEAIQALKSGEVDCLFPVSFTDSDAEDREVLITNPQMPSEMRAVVRSAALGGFSLNGTVTAAVSEDDPNTDIFLMDHFPDWQRVPFKDEEACLRAVAEGKADCFLISNYRVNGISGMLDKYKLSTITTGAEISFSFAINREDGALYAMMNKLTNLVPTATVNAALAAYSYGAQKLTFAQFIRQHMLSVLGLAAVIVAVILVLLLRSQRSEKKIREAMNKIAVLNTELSDNQQKLKEALAASEQASKAKTSFLSNMSHEIRTPMNAIIGLDNIALRDQDLSPHTREQLEKIGASAKHLLGIINDILDMSRIESGRMALQEEEFSFRDFLDQINVMINGQCVDKGLHFECNIIGHTEDYYVGDDMKLKQVMINILGNAVKFTPKDGTVTFNVEQIQRFEQHCVLRFVMKDTGIGMSKEFIPKIFEAFSQENEVSVSRHGSTGLGMAITKSIVSMMNGEIHVDSEKGVGTTFTVTVTLRVSDRSVGAHDGSLPANLRMLIVDDDPVAREYEQLVAESVGIASDTVESGEKALELIRANRGAGQPYQIVLTDYMMPGMDGLAFTRALRETDSGETAVILLTGYDWEDKQEQAMQAGVDSVISKPLFKDSLMRSAQHALRARSTVEAEPEQAPDAGSDAPGSLSGCRVLVVEDIELNADILMDLLDIEDIESERAENGQAAVTFYHNRLNDRTSSVPPPAVHLPLKGKAFGTASFCLPLEGKVAAQRADG